MPLTFREVIPRTYDHKLGGSPTAGRVYMATVDEPMSQQAVIDAIGIQLGSGHPDHAGLICDGISVDEPDRHHVTVTYSYGIPDDENNDPENPDAPPWLQADQWSFSSSNASVACKQHFPFNNPADTPNIARPLTNTAGDTIFGQSRAESELKITISASRLQIDLVEIRKHLNGINNAAWAGFPRHTVQFVGASASPDKLEWQGLVQKFWRVNIELIYRPSTHNLFLPNVGWNVIVNGRKQRAWTYITEKGVTEKVPSPHPVALNAAGGFLCGPRQDQASEWSGSTSDGDPDTPYYGG